MKLELVVSTLQRRKYSKWKVTLREEFIAANKTISSAKGWSHLVFLRWFCIFYFLHYSSTWEKSVKRSEMSYNGVVEIKRLSVILELSLFLFRTFIKLRRRLFTDNVRLKSRNWKFLNVFFNFSNGTLIFLM